MELCLLAEDFIRHINLERGLSHNTVDQYERDLKRWLRFLHDNGIPPDTDHVGVVHIRNFIQSLSLANRAPRTIVRYLSCLRAFFTFVCRYHGLSENPAAAVASPKLPDTLPRLLTGTEVARLLDACEQNYFRLYRVRDRCIVAVLACLGLRRQELMDLRLQDWDAEERVVMVRAGKGARDRALPLTDELISLGSAWLAVRPTTGEPYFFVSRHGQKLAAHSLQRMLQRIADAAGLESRPHLHMFRHFAGTAIVNNHSAGGIEQARRILGHASNSTVSVYAHLGVDDLRAAVRDTGAISGLPLHPGPSCEDFTGAGPAVSFALFEMRRMVCELPENWQTRTVVVDWLVAEWSRHCLPTDGRPYCHASAVAVLYERQTVTGLTLDQHFALAEFGRAVRRRMLGRRDMTVNDLIAVTEELGAGIAGRDPVGEGATVEEIRAIAGLLPNRGKPGDVAERMMCLVTAAARLHCLKPDLPNGRVAAEAVAGLLCWSCGLPPLVIPASQRLLWDLLVREIAAGNRGTATVFCASLIQGMAGAALQLSAIEDNAGHPLDD
ncbi:MAG: tyrosine-type recombinase/integrase [Armatimonadia bacterium]